MGCGNSTAATTAGSPEHTKYEAERTPADKEKWKNYGGVYVGSPPDSPCHAISDPLPTTSDPLPASTTARELLKPRPSSALDW